MAALLLTGCGDPAPVAEPDRCPDLAATLVADLQRYVDVATGVAPDTPAAPVPDVPAALDRTRLAALERDCDPRALGRAIGEGVTGLRASGSLGQALVTALRQDLLGGDTGPRRIDVAPEDDLAAVLRTARAGSTVVLAAGEHRVSETLVLLRSVQVVGAGEAVTSVVSTAAEAAVLSLGQGELTLRSLSVRREGDAPGSVVVVAGGSAALRSVALSGGRESDSGEGGAALGVLGDVGSGATRLEQVTVSDSTAGLVAAGAARLQVHDSVVREVERCGLCALDDGRVEMTATRVEGNGVGVSAIGDATVDVSRSEVVRSGAAGLVSAGSAALSVVETVITGNGDVGVSLGGDAGGGVVGSVVDGHSGVGVLVLAGSPEVSDNDVVGNDVGVQVESAATPGVTGNRLADSRLAALVLRGTSGGTVSGNTCTGQGSGLLLEEQAAPTVEGGTCPVVDRRP